MVATSSGVPLNPFEALAAFRRRQAPAARLDILQHASPSYGPRTYKNAKSAGLTAAFAVDFETRGEALTRKAAGDAYVAIPLSQDVTAAARCLYAALRARDAHSLNIAGNGIYTLDKNGWTQEEVNAHLYAVLSLVVEHWPLELVVSGGQTGVDIAGVTVAHALGIPAIATLPNGFRQRGADKVDRLQSEGDIRRQVVAWAAALSASPVSPQPSKPRKSDMTM